MQQYGVAYFDGASPFVNNATRDAMGFAITSSDVHPTATGAAAYGYFLSRFLDLNNWAASSIIAGNGSGLTNVLLSEMATNGLSSFTSTDSIVGHVPWFTNNGIVYFIDVSTNNANK